MQPSRQLSKHVASLCPVREVSHHFVRFARLTLLREPPTTNWASKPRQPSTRCRLTRRRYPADRSRHRHWPKPTASERCQFQRIIGLIESRDFRPSRGDGQRLRFVLSQQRRWVTQFCQPISTANKPPPRVTPTHGPHPDSVVRRGGCQRVQCGSRRLQRFQFDFGLSQSARQSQFDCMAQRLAGQLVIEQSRLERRRLIRRQFAESILHRDPQQVIACRRGAVWRGSGELDISAAGASRFGVRVLHLRCARVTVYLLGERKSSMQISERDRTASGVI